MRYLNTGYERLLRAIDNLGNQPESMFIQAVGEGFGIALRQDTGEWFVELATYQDRGWKHNYRLSVEAENLIESIYGREKKIYSFGIQIPVGDWSEDLEWLSERLGIQCDISSWTPELAIERALPTFEKFVDEHEKYYSLKKIW